MYDYWWGRRVFFLCPTPETRRMNIFLQSLSNLIYPLFCVLLILFFVQEGVMLSGLISPFFFSFIGKFHDHDLCILLVTLPSFKRFQIEAINCSYSLQRFIAFKDISFSNLLFSSVRVISSSHSSRRKFFSLVLCAPLLTMPFIQLDSWLAGRACKQNSTPNLWRSSMLLGAVVNPYSSEVVKFSADHAGLSYSEDVPSVVLNERCAMEGRRHRTSERRATKALSWHYNKRWALLFEKYHHKHLQRSKRVVLSRFNDVAWISCSV